MKITNAAMKITIWMKTALMGSLRANISTVHGVFGLLVLRPCSGVIFRIVRALARVRPARPVGALEQSDSVATQS